MAATNSANKLFKSDSQNCDVTLSGQPADKNLSVKVSSAHTVRYTSSTSNVSLVSQVQSGIVRDSNNMPYRTDSVQYSWKHNRNTQGSIDGTISIKASRNASYKGEFYKDNIFDGALPLTISGIKNVPTSDQRSEREDNVSITCTIPVNTSTNDLHGGTYTFKSDMNGQAGWGDNIRGMFQTYYNEVEPVGHLVVEPADSKYGSRGRWTYTGGKWIDADYLVGVTPGVQINPNMPSIKYGDVSGKLSITENDTIKPTPSQSIYSFSSNSSFRTTPSDKSNSSVAARDIKVNYSFSRDNSKNASTDTGSFTVHQEGGKIDAKDPEITYNWEVTPNADLNQYITTKKHTSTVQGKKDNGNYQSFSYTTGFDIIPMSSMDGRKGALDGNIVLGDLSDDVRGNKLSTSKLTYLNSLQTSDRQYTVTCGIDTKYVTNDTITPRSVSQDVTVQGAKWTKYPQVTIEIKSSYVDENGNESTNLPLIPGTSNYPSISFSTNGNKYTKTVEYVIKTGDQVYPDQARNEIDLSKYKTYVRLSDNTPSDSNGGGNTGKFTWKANIYNGDNSTASASDLSCDSHTGTVTVSPIKTGDSAFKINPSATSSFPSIKWKVTAKITSKTQDCTGTVTLDSSKSTRYVTQSAIPASSSTSKPAKASMSIPDFCTWDNGLSDTLTWEPNDAQNYSEQSASFTINEYKRKDFSWQMDYDSSSGKYSFSHDTKNDRTGDITLTLPSGTSIDSSSTEKTTTVKLTQHAEDIYGKIKVTKFENYTGTSVNTELGWGTSFTMSKPSPNEPVYNYTASLSIQSGVSNHQISSDGATITGTIETGGSASKGTDITCSAKFELTGTNNDDAKYYGTDDAGFHEVSDTVTGISPSLRETDYEVRCTNADSVTVDKNRGTFSISIGANNSSAASISSIEWTDPASDHKNDMLSNPYKVTAKKGGKVASTRTFKIEVKPAGGSWRTEYTITQPAGDPSTGSNTSATQGFTVSVADNCQVTVDPMELSITSEDTATSTGPSVSLITGNQSDGRLVTTSLPTDSTLITTVKVDDKSETVSFFNTTKDITIECPAHYQGGSASLYNGEMSFKFKYKAAMYPNGKSDMVSQYGGDDSKFSDSGVITDCKFECSADNVNWTDFTHDNGHHIKLVFKSSEINVRSTSDKVYTKTGYARIVDSAGNVLATATGTATLTVAKVQYYNS